MASKYIFYDLETTGKGKKETSDAFNATPKWEQILQIAAIVVDENFTPTMGRNPVNKRTNMQTAITQ